MKHTNQKILLFCFMLATLSGCIVATEERYSKILDSWLGKEVKYIVEQLGPAKTYPLPNGLTAYEYNQHRVETKGGGYTPEVIQVGQQSVFQGRRVIGMAPLYRTIYHKNPYYDVEYNCQTIFQVDKQGIVRHWNWKGNDCKSSQPLED